MRDLRSAIEALAKEYEAGDGAFVVAELTVAIRLRAILAECEEPDLEDASLPRMPVSRRTVTLYTEEPLREALKTRLNEASETIDLLRIGADNETDTVIDCMEAVRLVDAFDAALSRESVPVTDGERWWNKGQAELAGDPEYEAAKVELEEKPPAKPAEPTLGLLRDEDECFGKELKVYPAKPAASPILPFMGAGECPAELLTSPSVKPPAPKRWRCTVCGGSVRESVVKAMMDSGAAQSWRK